MTLILKFWRNNNHIPDYRANPNVKGYLVFQMGITQRKNIWFMDTLLGKEEIVKWILIIFNLLIQLYVFKIRYLKYVSLGILL